MFSRAFRLLVVLYVVFSWFSVRCWCFVWGLGLVLAGFGGYFAVSRRFSWASPFWWVLVDFSCFFKVFHGFQGVDGFPLLLLLLRFCNCCCCTAVPSLPLLLLLCCCCCCCCCCSSIEIQRRYCCSPSVAISSPPFPPHRVKKRLLGNLGRPNPRTVYNMLRAPTRLSFPATNP